jgi:hypothetical protein
MHSKRKMQLGEDMKTKPNNSARASALQITFSIALIFVSAILLALAAVATPTLGNYPDTSLALSTDTTVTPDAPPINTTSINVSTSTDFKGTLAGDPTTGVVRVTDAHPAGTYTVTVTAFDSGGATATGTFTLTVTTPVTCTPVGFSAATKFAVGNNPISVAVGDFNGDGKQDLAAANGGSGNVSILLGDGTGNFSAARNFGVGSTPYSVAVGDFNGDGKQDLATANAGYSSNNVSILLGDGAGNFSAATNFGAGAGPYSVAVGDFNGDGKQDLAVSNLASNNVSILLGDGTGNFSGPTNFDAGDNFQHSVAVCDFNGDGKQDLAVTNYNSDNVSILLRDCRASQISPAGTTCNQFASGTTETLNSVQYDVNNDLIQRLVPHNFLYWVKVTASAGNNTLRITQTITTGNFNTFFASIGSGSNVFDSNCVSLERSGGQSGNTVQVRFNAPAAGTYFIGINFSAHSLIGQPAPSPTTVHYDFTTNGVPDSISGLDLVPH